MFHVAARMSSGTCLNGTRQTVQSRKCSHRCRTNPRQVRHAFGATRQAAPWGQAPPSSQRGLFPQPAIGTLFQGSSQYNPNIQVGGTAAHSSRNPWRIRCHARLCTLCNILTPVSRGRLGSSWRVSCSGNQQLKGEAGARAPPRWV